MSVPEKADIAILTIVDAEIDAVKKVFSLEGPVEKNDRIYYYGKTPTKDGRECSIVCTKSNHIGNNSASLAVADIIATFHPEVIFLVGIAGGIQGEKDLALGDVVVSNDIEYYELEKQKGEERIDRSGKLANPSMMLLRKTEITAATQWEKNITVSPPTKQEKPTKAIQGMIVSGEKLLGDPNSQELKKILTKYHHPLAVEMEGGGFSRAILEKGKSSQDYLIIRGISDFCNVSNNQKSRDDWRDYAANAAATFTKKMLENTPINKGQKSPYDTYLSELQNAISQKPNVEFSLEIAIDGKKIPAETLIEPIMKLNRIFLKGAAGAGKSSIVAKTSRHLIEKDIVPVIIKPKKENMDSDSLKEKTEPDEKMEILMNHSVVPIPISKIMSFGKKVCIIIDGLNETSGGEFGQTIPQLIVKAVEEFLKKNYGNAIALITDRMESRDFLDQWKTAKMLPLSDEEVKAIVDERFGKGKFDSLKGPNQKLLNLPYLLDLALQMDSPELLSVSMALGSYFEKQVGLSNTSIDKMAEIIFSESTKHGLSFELEKLSVMNDDDVKKILASGMLQQQTDKLFMFDHQLKHDYLLSRHLANKPDLWDGLSFDIASLESNSLEPIQMTLEQIQDKEIGDAFILRVYDWNWNAAIKAVNHVSKLGLKNCSDEIIIAMLALVAQKISDAEYFTSIKAKERLIEFGTTFAQELAKTNNLKDISKKIEEHGKGPQWFENWKSLFTKDRKSKLDEEDISMILSENSLYGWTASNVFRECKIDEENSLQARTICNSSEGASYRKSAIRWRVIHFLGAMPTKKNSELLLKVLKNDPNHWVKYGAARSLIEMAAKSKGDLRKHILEELRKIIPALPEKIIDEIGKTVFYRKAEKGWDTDALSILNQIMSLKKEEQHKEKWGKDIKMYGEGKWKN